MQKITCLVIGLDGATWDLIRQWVDSGELPTFKMLTKDGVWGHLKSTFHPISAQAWPAFYTGKNSGKHGVFDFVTIDSDYNLRPISYIDVNSKKLWGIISETGKKCAVLNVPVTYPPEKINGIMVSGLLTPSENCEYTYPKAFKKKLKELVGKYRIDLIEYYKPGNEKRFVNDLHELLTTRFKLIDYFLCREIPDFLIAVIMGTDEIQHAMWKYMDKEHPLHTPDKEKYRDAILEYYKILDNYLGSIIKSNRFRNLIIFSDHGSGRLAKRFNTNEWLREQGYLTFKGTSSRGILQRIGFTKGTARRLISVSIRLKLAWVVKFLEKRSFLYDRISAMPETENCLDIRDIDFRSTKAFSTGSVGRIYINSKDKFSRGTVEPKDYYNLRKEIIKKLSSIKDPVSKKKIDIEIYPRAKIFTGPYVENAPDILFMMKNMEYAASRPYNIKGKIWIDIPEEDPQSASHRMNGIFIAYGSDIKNGEILEEATIYDIAPTILHILGLPVPKDMDGRVLKEIFKQGLPLEKLGAQLEREKERIMERIQKMKGSRLGC